MRIKINFTRNTENIDIQNQSMVNSYIHTCLGRNNKYHDSMSNYCISNLQGGKYSNGVLNFENGGYIIVSSIDAEFINTLIIGVLNNPNFIGGMRFSGIDHIEERFHNGWNYFATLSPFIIKERTKNGYEFLTLNDNEFEVKLKQYLINKLTKFDETLDLSDFDIKVPNHPSHKVKKIMVKNVINHANQCHVSVHTNYEVAKLLYEIGLGQSTGSGFGVIYKTENRRLYR